MQSEQWEVVEDSKMVTECIIQEDDAKCLANTPRRIPDIDNVMIIPWP